MNRHQREQVFGLLVHISQKVDTLMTNVADAQVAIDAMTQQLSDARTKAATTDANRTAQLNSISAQLVTVQAELAAAQGGGDLNLAGIQAQVENIVAEINAQVDPGPVA